MGRPNVDRLFDLDAPRHFLARLVEVKLLPMVWVSNTFGPGMTSYRNTNLLAGAPQLQHRQQLAARHQTLLDGSIHDPPQHPPRVAAWLVPPRRNVQAVGVGAPRRIQGRGHLLHPNREVRVFLLVE
ncbi:hypothetical protein [Nitrospira sp. Nam74]